MISQTAGGEKVRSLNHTLLSLGIACALLIGGLAYVLKNLTSWTPVNDSLYLALRGAYRIVDLLHLQSTTPVATSVLRRQLPSGSQRLGIEIVVVVTVSGVAAAVWLLLSLVSYAPNVDALVRRLTLATLVFAAPACYLTVSWLTWTSPLGEPAPLPRGNFFRENLLATIFIGEMACVFALLLWRYFQKRVTSKWGLAIFVLLHFAFWVFELWQGTRFWFFPVYSTDLVLLLILALPFVHILQQRHQLDRTRENRPTVWSIGAGIALLVPFGAVWAPAKNVQLSHPHNLDALKIELARGPCFGSCAQYTITVQGDGRVEYVGRRGHSRSETRKLGSIDHEKIMQILQTLDQVKFMTLDDRAFSWAFDTPSVGVRVWEDGKTKQVVSDAVFVGYKFGRQARFVEATREIDRILEPTQWSQCEGEECANPTSAKSSPE
jgi:hypothetical protein